MFLKIIIIHPAPSSTGEEVITYEMCSLTATSIPATRSILLVLDGIVTGGRGPYRAQVRKGTVRASTDPATVH